MPASTVKQAVSANRILEASVVVSLFGMVGLALTGMLGFEEPNGTLLLFSSVLMVAAPVTMLVHLSVTRELTREEKRIWIREFTGSRAPGALSDYLSCDNRRATARRRAEEALARRPAKHSS